MAHVRQSRPDDGLGYQVKVVRIVRDVASWLGSGIPLQRWSVGGE